SETLVFSADIKTYTDYYAFGMEMVGRNWSESEAYRQGYNGKENDKDFGEGVQDYGFRIYDNQIAKFLSVDPLTKDYPWYTPYQFAGNKCIMFVDIDGLEEGYEMRLRQQELGYLKGKITSSEIKEFHQANATGALLGLATLVTRGAALRYAPTVLRFFSNPSTTPLKTHIITSMSVETAGQMIGNYASGDNWTNTDVLDIFFAPFKLDKFTQAGMDWKPFKPKYEDRLPSIVGFNKSTSTSFIELGGNFLGSGMKNMADKNLLSTYGTYKPSLLYESSVKTVYDGTAKTAANVVNNVNTNSGLEKNLLQKGYKAIDTFIKDPVGCISWGFQQFGKFLESTSKKNKKDGKD
ncbi:MAG: hypothetical protein EAY69_00060, partial [Cytophagales bacterium]